MSEKNNMSALLSNFKGEDKNMHDDLSEEQVEYVLKNELLGHMGCHADDITYVVPICYAYDGKCIYGRTYEGMKMKIVRENPDVCFQVEYIKNMANWQSVICWGQFEELTDITKRNEAIHILQERIIAVVESNDLKHSPYWPFSITDLDNVKGIFFCIHLNKKTGRFSS